MELENLKTAKQARELHDAVEKITVTGEAGGGFVRVTVNGISQILRIDYEDNPFITQDLKMYNDLIIMAFNVATEKIREKVVDFVAKYTPSEDD